MEKDIKLNKTYNSVEQLCEHLRSNSTYQVSVEYDTWENKLDADGQLKKCVLLKKSAMHGVKLDMLDNQNVQVKYVVPDKTMNALFGDNKKRYRSPIDIVTGKVKDLILSGSKKKAFDEMSQSLNQFTN